ncbi:helix-turn-helix domain-containing protein [Methylovulum psychrotolerans]|jgi:transcriptional regulator with XRE-family HTH domain|nr:helix-turn-helix transcriptional regulator [Methylovulum psychrotolerans]
MLIKINEESIIKEVAARFRTERLRLGLSQYDVALLCSVTSRSVISWENGVKMPAHHLAELARHGFDVKFVLTAIKTEDGTHPNANVAFPPYKTAKIVELFDALNENQQMELLAAAEEKLRINELTKRVNQLQELLSEKVPKP